MTASPSEPLSLRFLAWDTRHFGARMGMLEMAQTADLDQGQGIRASVKAAVADAAAQGYQQLAARARPRQTAWIHALEAAGFRLVDTLVTLEVSLGDQQAPAIAAAIRPAVATDVPVLMDIARQAFADRSIWLDRFHADPHIPPERADAVYAEWIKNSVTPASPAESMADHTLVAAVAGAPVGFLTCRLVPGAGERVGQVSLNAVHRDYRKRGLYQSLVQRALCWFHGQGCRRAQVSTNVTSEAVQRAWYRLGAVPARQEHTFHWWAEPTAPKPSA